MTTLRTVKLAGMRGLIAKKMSESLARAAQLSFFCDVDATALVAARQAWKAADVPLGYEDLIIHALAGVLVGFPAFNAIETTAGFELQSEINVGCAISLPGGLVAPALFDVATLDVPAIALARADLVARAKLGKLTIEEHTSGTISVTNLGLTRTKYFTPIVNYPQVAIIGLGQIARGAWLPPGGTALEIRPSFGLSLTVDHRIIDGAPAGEFLTALANAIEAIAPPG
jgi:pyruvate dehydrogenase E2 component (dihydrolipoamide acetyltransferase)